MRRKSLIVFSSDGMNIIRVKMREVLVHPQIDTTIAGSSSSTTTFPHGLTYTRFDRQPE